MKIEYKILWIEDSLDWLAPMLEKIKTYLDDLGFILKCEVIPKYEERDFSQYDIIVIDYNLSNEEKGSSAIKIIRSEKGIFTEILFYSYLGEPTIRQKVANNHIDGVYCADRENCVERLQRLIDTTIRKTQEINNLRGLVMAETSVLDKLIKDILLKMEWTEERFVGCHKKRGGYHDQQKKKLIKLLPFDVKNLGPFLNGHFNSMSRFFLLEKFITKEDWNSIKEYEEVMHKRNALAHGTETLSSAEKIIIEKTRPDGSTESLTFTPDGFVRLRKKIKKFRDKFKQISHS